MFINIGNWSWPQWAMIILWIAAFLLEAFNHNQPKRGKRNVFTGMIGVGISMFIIISGGFFK